MERRKIFEAPINHEQEPHCCGCWVFWADDGDFYAQCNECGERRSVIDLLALRAASGADGDSPKYSYAKTIDYAKRMGLPTEFPEPAGQGATAVTWRIRIGDSDSWGYCDTETDADFYGKQSGLRYVKEPLYLAHAHGEREPSLDYRVGLESAISACEKLACPDTEAPYRCAPGYEYFMKAAAAIRSLAAPAKRSEGGFVMVPREPTAEMYDAFMSLHAHPVNDDLPAEPHTWSGDFGNFVASYWRMLAALPAAAVQEGAKK